MLRPLGCAVCAAALLSAAEPAVLETLSGKIYGTLEIPQTKTPPPVVLFIAGSGPTDRDGNTGSAAKSDSLRLLAEALRDRGIASLRYDKRGIGQSRAAGGQETELRFENYAEDAAAWAKQLAADKRFREVTIAGHSEGSLLGMLAASKGGAAKYISLEGPGRAAYEVLAEQLKGKLPPVLVKSNDWILESLKAGKTVPDTPPELAALYRASVQPYLISWFKYDPAREIGKLQIPVLIVQGTTDIQVGVADARLLAGARPKATLLVIEGMNHILKDVPADRAKQMASYNDPTLPVDPKLIDAIANFVH
jgi:alpha-beta hydrolase superfamily lysophospholipase